MPDPMTAMTAEQPESLQQFLTRLVSYRGQNVNGNRLSIDAAAQLAKLPVGATAEQLRAELSKLWREMADFRCAGGEMTADAVHMYMREYADQLRAIAARLSGMAAVPDGWVLLPRRLTAENGAKAALWGEVRSVLAHEFVPWPDIKTVHNAVVKLFDGKAPSAPEHPHG